MAISTSRTDIHSTADFHNTWLQIWANIKLTVLTHTLNKIMLINRRQIIHNTANGVEENTHLLSVAYTPNDLRNKLTGILLIMENFCLLSTTNLLFCAPWQHTMYLSKLILTEDYMHVKIVTVIITEISISLLLTELLFQQFCDFSF